MKKYKQPAPFYHGKFTETWANETSKYMLPGKLYREQCLGATFSITAADDTFEDTGLVIVLPQEGFYIIDWCSHAHVQMASSVEGSLTAMLYDDNGAIANSEHMILWSHDTHEHGGSASCMKGYLNTKKGNSIKMYIKSNTAGAFTTRELDCDTRGRTHLKAFYYGKLDEDITSVV